MDLLQKARAVGDVGVIPVPLAWGENREGRDERGTGTIIREKRFEAIEGGH